MIGENALLDGRNPIAFCNLLFAGNVVAGVTLLAIFHRDWRPSELKKLTPKQWLIQLILAATSGALAPSLMFQAIERTSVTNIVLIETVEIPLGLLLAWLLYREKSSWSAVIGALLALGGVGTTLWLQTGQPSEMMQQGQMSGGIGLGRNLCDAWHVSISIRGRTRSQATPIHSVGRFQRLPQFRRLNHISYRRTHYARTGTLYGSLQTRPLGLDGVVWERGCRRRSTLLVFGDQTSDTGRYLISLRIFTNRRSHLRIPNTRRNPNDRPDHRRSSYPLRHRSRACWRPEIPTTGEQNGPDPSIRKTNPRRSPASKTEFTEERTCPIPRIPNIVLASSAVDEREQAAPVPLICIHCAGSSPSPTPIPKILGVRLSTLQCSRLQQFR